MRPHVFFFCLAVLVGCAPPRTSAPLERKQLPRRPPPASPTKVDSATRETPATPYAFEVLDHTVPRKVERDSTVVVLLKVKNTSTRAWPKNGPIKAGCYWLDRFGTRVANPEGRANIRKDVPPGATVHVRCTIRPPSSPGEYRLVFDMVEENVAWFGSKGARPLKVRVTVS